VTTAGSTLTVSAATGMGSGANGVASALVNNGGIPAIGNTAALNGAVTVEAGGQLNANQATGLTGAGALTFNEGSILNIVTQALGFSGTQAAAATINPGTLVKLNVGSFGAAATTLDSVLGSGANSVSYIHIGNNAVNPTSAGTAVYTLNKSSGGIGGVLTNNTSNQSVSALANGNITLGANGGVIAATSNTTFTVSENVTGAGSLTIGTTDIIDGAPKLGIVNLNTATNAFTGGVIINAGTLRAGVANTLGTSLTNQVTVNTGGTLDMSPGNQTIGNLTGTGGIINAAGRVLTIGNGDTGGGNFQGSIQGASAALTKTGSSTITLSGTNTYNGPTAINAGKLFINGDQTSASGAVTVAATATLGGTGTIGGSTTIAATGKLEFDLSTAAASHDKLDLAAGKILTFSGASVLTITSSGGASPGIYTLLTAPGGITGSAPATLNLPNGWVASVSKVGNDLQLNVTSTGSVEIDHFAISSIAPLQTVGTPITGITITAQDAANQTATSFTGTVTFGGTAGITGTSASFVAGVLSGVNVTPAVRGTDLTLTVNDGAAHTGSATFTVQSMYAHWAGGPFVNPLTNTGPALNFDGGSLRTGIEWVVGGDPTNGSDDAGLAPTIDLTSDPDGKLLFSFRRTTSAKNDPNTTITVQYGGTLLDWTAAVHQGTGANQITITEAPGGPGFEIVTVALPTGLAGGGKLFTRLHVALE